MGVDGRTEYPAATVFAAGAGAGIRVDAQCRPLAQGATTNQVSAELAEALSGIEAARRTENLLTNSLLPQAELTFKAALAGYETGKVDFATLLDAQRQIRQARQNQLKAQVDAQMRLAEIERLLGEDL
jgi:cobalt-zinc-cadmium efflux system outer membrane protein